MKIIDVWLAMDSDGYTHTLRGVFRTAEQAAKHVGYPGGYGVEPECCKAVLMDDNSTIWRLSGAGPECFSDDREAAISAAKAKLTTEERALLGIK